MDPISKIATGVILSIIAAAMPAGAQVCAGDCNADGVVEANELMRAVDMWVHPEQPSKCGPADFDGNGAVEIYELLLASRAFLGLGCGQPMAARAVTGPAVVEAGTAVGIPGGSATIEVRLHVNGREVAGVENLLTTDLPSPLCFSSVMVNPSINREATAWVLQGCDRLRVLVLSFTNLDPIPDGSVLYTVELGIAPSVAPGFYPINVLETGASDPNGNGVQTTGVAGGVFVGTAASTCGNGVVELDETCDDGNILGGDGCAANCTHERSIVASFPQSQGTIQAAAFKVPLAFTSNQEMLIGSPRPSDPNAIIPFVSTVSGTSFEPIPIPGLACICMRAAQIPSTPQDVSGVGEFGCGVGGTSDGSYHRYRDHNTNDVDPTCSQGTVEISQHVGVCNGPLLETRFGQSPAGSGFSNASVSLSLLADPGQCTTAYAGESPCPFPSYGADCLPCTADDAGIAQTFSLALTTGTAEAEIDDAANISGRRIGDGLDCGSQACTARVTGAPFSCSELAFGDTVSMGAWAAAHPVLDSPMISDNVLSIRLGAVAPTPSPTPTRTPTNTRTPTRTRTATATATIPTADGSLILTRVRIKADTATRAGRDNGSISARGTVNVNDPFAGFIDEVLATGVSATFSGAGGVQSTLAWTGPQCSARVTGRGPIVTCLGGNRDKIILKPSRVPNVFRLTIKAPRLDVQPPLTADPIFVELRTTASRRIDSIAGCELRGNVRTTCRETGFVGTTPTPTRTPTSTPTPSCPGDCNGNGVVTINELIQLINLGLNSGSSCPAADSDGSGSVDVTDGVRAVRAALMGCGPALPPPTPGAIGTTGVEAGTASGTVGGTATIEVRLQTAGLDVAAVENRLSLDTDAAVCFSGCQANAGLGKDASVFAIETCRSVKAWIMGFNLSTIPDGAILYTCDVAINSAPQPSSFTVPVTSVVTSDPRGFALPSIGIAGDITVGTSVATVP